MANHNPWALALFIMQIKDSKASHSIVVSGRDRWALECLIAARNKGCTPIDTPGPHWSAYVHRLRELGISIETIKETHGGPFSGSHARYVLCARMTRSKGPDA